MSIYDLASNNTIIKGRNYYKNKKVISIKKINDDEYEAIVQGTSKYQVYLNTRHPRKSKCNCPFATGTKVCKHMIAVYYTINPKHFEEYEEMKKREYLEAKEYLNKRRQDLIKIKKECEEYVNKLTIERTKEMLVEYLVNERYYTNEEDDYYEEIYYESDYFDEEEDY